MERRFLKKENLPALMKRLIGRYQVFAPQLGERSIEFAPLADADAPIQLATPSSKWPPKRFLFPQSETLLKFDFNAHDASRVSPPPAPERPVLLWGLRPCDAHSFAILDQVFLAQEGVRDPYYGLRRQNTTVIAIACDAPARTCFCVSVEGGPHDNQGADVLLRDTGPGYIAEIMTDRGAAALEGVMLDTVGPADMAMADQNKAAAESKARIDLDLRAFFDRLMAHFNDPLWDRIHEKCIGCGACTFLCPTCHCFDIQDERDDADGRRVRNWDSCMFPSFTLHASGHNPRQTRRERWRQRAMHKFNYYPTKFGPFACVGCGRCVRDCPTGVDIRQILLQLQEAAVSHV